MRCESRFYLGCLMLVMFVLGSSVTRAGESSPYVSKVWVADNGDGTYTNPILFADYSDPDVCRVGDDYYMTASSFTCMPGLPILHSKDLVNWRLVGHALPRMYPEEVFDHPQHARSVWAPCIRYHKNEFYIYWGDPDFGIHMVRATNAAGPWSKPVVVKAGKGLIDPSPLWDDDGKAYLVHAWAASRSQINSILTLHRMNPEGTQVIDDGKHIIDGHGKHPTLEGPKFYRRNGYYYIFAPGGGVAQGWQAVFRSKDIYGPYKDKIVLAQGDTQINGPHQGGWVQTPSGESWFIHFQEHQPYGRIIHLQPVQWIDGWPVMGIDEDGDGQGEPVLTHKKPDVGRTYPIVTPAESDEFNGDTLGLQWQWCANPDIRWSVMLRETDYLRLMAIRPDVPEGMTRDDMNFWHVPNLLLQKFPAPAFTATTKVTFTEALPGKHTGLIILGRDYAYLNLNGDTDSLTISQVVCHNADQGGQEQKVAETTVEQTTLYLRVTIGQDRGRSRFSYSLDNQNFTVVGETFNTREGGWIGAKVGLFCISEPDAPRGGYADFDWFRIEPVQ